MSAPLQPLPGGIGFEKLVGFGAYRAWLERACEALASSTLVKPRGVLLVGTPGCGKLTCARATALRMDRPLLRPDPDLGAGEWCALLESLDPCVLWLGDLATRHRPVLRWMTSHAKLPALVIASCDRPWDLPAELLRADGFDRVYHLDLPDGAQRGRLWEAAIDRYRGSPAAYDPVRLAQASGLFSPAEIMAATRRAFIACGEESAPRERDLIEQVGRIVPLALKQDEDLARLRHWARRHALDAHQGPDHRV